MDVSGIYKDDVELTSESRFDECVRYLGRCCGVHLRAVLRNVSGI